MSAAENKQLIQHIFSDLSKGQGIQSLVEAMADDFCWTVTGTSKWSRTYHGKQAVLKDLLGAVGSQFADQYIVTPHRIIAEDDYVVVECYGKVTTKTGKLYNNTYCWIFRIAGDKLQELTEYGDTHLIAEVLEDPA